MKASWRDPKFGARSLTQYCLCDRDRKERGREGGGRGGGEKNAKGKMEFQDACKLPSSMVFERNIANSFTIIKSFEKSAEHAQVLDNCS